MRLIARVLMFFVVAAALLGAAPAFAQTSTTTTTHTSAHTGFGWDGWGVRVGASVDPDQIYGGVHFNLGYFAKDVRFRPSIEMGFGDNVTTISALAEVHYIFSKVQVWKPYVGGGLGLGYINADEDDDDFGDNSDTEVAFMGIGGVETKLRSGSSLFFEGKVGFGDNDPDFKFGVGWSFK